MAAYDSLSVIIPAYNEEDRILPTVRRIREYLEGRFGDFEIIVIDDASTDATAGLVEREIGETGNLRLLRNAANLGKGGAVKKGMLSSRGSLCLMSDADLSVPIEEMEKLLPHLEGGYHIAIGSKSREGAEMVVKQPWYREKMGRVFNLVVRLLLVGDFRDTQCGFKLFRGDVARDVFVKTSIEGFSFDVEVLYIALKQGYRVKEVPMRLVNSPASRVKLFRDPLMMFLDLLKIRLKRFRA
jgi:dolichyl-phosphate beta-glucosyltransferase